MKETENKNTDTDREGGYTDMTDDIDRELRERRRQRRLRRQKRERRKKIMILGATGIITLVVVAGAVNGIAGFIRHSSTQSASSTKETQKKEDSQEVPAEQQGPSAMEQAKLLAAQYDYQSAIDLLKKQSDYESNTDMQNAVKEYESDRDSCTSWPLEEVTHVFYHTLIKDTSKAFDGDYKEADYNQVMTTIDEFNKITETMYEKGYVMVSIYDMAKANDDGTMTPGEILLPPGKIPFVLSQDDVCYYHYMDGDGFATKLVVDDEGKVRNEYVEDDGSISVGDYDMVPLIDRFVEKHPDFSYRGAKGIVALTGYNGILGYRTDQSYETRPDDLDQNKVDWLDSHPDFSLEKEREGAKKVADAMKEEGWLFASHTWGHQNIGQISLETLQADTQKFKDNVDPLIGGTDIIIFAFGTDLTDAEDYSGDKFEYLKSMGYNYYCNVDSSKYFVQIRDRYFRQGRRNLDGYRMYYNPELLEDLFDAKILTAVLTAAALAGGGYFPTDIGNRLTKTVSAAKKDSDKKDDTSESEGSVLDQATLMYQQYNYDEAIKLLKQQDDFDTNKDFFNAIPNGPLKNPSSYATISLNFPLNII